MFEAMLAIGRGILSKSSDGWEQGWAEGQAMMSWCCFPQDTVLVTPPFAEAMLSQHRAELKGILQESSFYFLNLDYSELKHVFSKESWIDAESHMSGITGVPYKQTRTWKGTPWVTECFPGLGSKASCLLNNNVFFPCYFMYLFYRSLVPFIHSYPLWKHTCILQEHS